jgi:hypothetical protein
MKLRHSMFRKAAGKLAMAAALACGAVQAQPTAAISDDVVKIGMLLDMSGLYADVRFADDFERVRVSTAAERQTVLARIRIAVGQAGAAATPPPSTSSPDRAS